MEIVPDVVIPPLPTTVRGEGLHLGGTTKIEPRIVYGSNNLTIQRNLEEPNNVRINPEHAVKVTCAQFSPNGEWVCSGDNSGQVYVWAHKSFVVKNTISVGKEVLQIAFSADGQRIVAVGRGKEETGKVFPWNTNNKLGELSGATKGYLCCDFKPTRPFRVAAGSEDNGVYFFKGPPFKFECSYQDHKNVIRALRFTPDGAAFVTVSSDKTIRVFDAKTGQFQRLIADGKGKNGQHKGSIYELSFADDGKHFVTASADKTCKVWNFESGEVVHTFTFADKPALMDMQISCLWMGAYLVSLSLSGKINYLDAALKEERPLKVLTGHRKSIKDCAFDAQNNALYTVDSDSRVVRTECKTMEPADVSGDPHKGTQITFVRTTCDSSALYTIAVNDTLCCSPLGDDDEKGGGAVLSDKTLKLAGAARGLMVGHKDAALVLVPTHRNNVQFVDGGALEVTAELKVGYSPLCCALAPDDSVFALGSGQDGELAVCVYDVQSREEVCRLQNKQFIRSEAICLAFSGDGKLLATAHKDKKIWIWDFENRKFDEPLNAKNGMAFHSGKISSIEFSPQAPWSLLTSGNDGCLYVFYRVAEGRSDNYSLQHAFSGLVQKAMWLAQNKIAAIGGDCSIRFFDVQEKK